MDTETNPIENESEPVELCESINENGCDESSDDKKPKVVEAVTQQLDKDKDSDQTIESENDQKHGDENDDSEISPIKPPTDKPIVLSASETESYEIIDSENPSENNSPEKNSSATITEAVATVTSDSASESASEVTEIKVVETEELETATETTPSDVSLYISAVEVRDVNDESANDKNWTESNENLEKKSSDMACLIPSPSDQMNESVDEKNESWDRLNESIDEINYDGSIDDEDVCSPPSSNDDGLDDADGADNEFNKKSNPKTIDQQSPCRPNHDGQMQIFELTDDNSSVDDTRESEGFDDEEEEDEDDEDGIEEEGK